MSGGSYNYLYAYAAGLEAQREDIQAMKNRLRGLAQADVPGARLAYLRTALVLAHLQAAEDAARKVSDVWFAIEWCDSGDWSEDQVRGVLAKLLED